MLACRWTVAHVFKSDHLLAAPLKEHVFQFFAKHYVDTVLVFNGNSKDMYRDLWQVGRCGGVLWWWGNGDGQ